MIGKQESAVTVTTTDTTNIVKATISADKQAKLFDLLQNPYSDAIGSIVREITSNCIDSHVEANCIDKAVIIQLDIDETGSYISFEDFGIGMDEQFMHDRYSRYLDSTKENTNNQIGFFGIGSKSPLSYTSQFFLNTVKNGIELQYVIRKDDDGIPAIQKIVDFPTDQANGTKVYFYVDSDDKSKFINAISEQLKYFNNVYVVDNWNKIKQPEYKIFEGRTFKLRLDDSSDKNFTIGDTLMHLVIQNVTYPIDWKQLDKFTDPIRLAIALKFDIGELNVTMTRENIKYTRATIELIETRLTEFYAEISEISIKSADEPNYKDAIQQYNKVRLNFSDEYAAYITHVWKLKDCNTLLITYPWKTIIFSGLNGFVKKWEKAVQINSLFDIYYISKCYSNGVIERHTDAITNIVYSLEKSDNKSAHVFRMDDTVSQKKIDYIFDTINSHFYLMKRTKLSLRLFRKTFSMKSIPKSKWREFIVDYLTATEEFFVKRTHKYEDIKIPYEWFLDNKPSDNKISIENPFGFTNYDVIINYFTMNGSQSEKCVSTVGKLISQKNKEYNRIPTIVLHQGSFDSDAKNRIRNLFGLNMFTNVRVMYTSITNVGLLSTLDGFYSMEQLKSNSAHVLGAIATTFLIQRSFILNSKTDVSIIAQTFENLVPEWKDRFESLRAFLLQYQDYGNRFKRDINLLDFGKFGNEIVLSLVEAAISNRTLNYQQIETTEFICSLINRYGNNVAIKGIDIYDLIAHDIACRRTRIFPIKYYVEFYRRNTRQKKNPTTCNVLGFGASLIHKHLITTT